MSGRLLIIIMSCMLCSFWLGGCDCGSVVQGCDKDADCQGARCPEARCICRDGQCIPVECTRDFHCESGYHCRNNKCVPIGPDRCTSDEDCPEGQKCNPNTGLCGCTSDDDCPPGMECDLITKICKDKSKCDPQQCTNERICCDLDDGQGERCNFQRCLKHDDCREGSKNTCVKPLTCQQGILPICAEGVCKCEEPCGGGDCGPGKCCDVGKNACIENPKPCPDLKCPPGFDPPPDSAYTIDPKTCKLSGPPCECVKRPPLDVGDMGTYSAIALFDGRPVISAYNSTYGDLVVGYQQSNLTVKWEFVDGVPTNANPTGATDGPRNGISDPGDDVGLHTAIATQGQTIHISYFDATNGALKYARKDGAKWHIHTVDNNGKKVGRFTSLTLVNGQPVIAYFVADDGKGQSALRIALAQSAAPSSASDWTINTADSAPVLNCLGKCDSSKKQVCVDDNNQAACQVPTKDCSPDCASGQVCFNKICMTQLGDDAHPPLPPGVGLFPSIAAQTGVGIAVVYYDSNLGDLRIARSEGGKFVSSTLKKTGDVGRQPSLAISTTNELHISYVNQDTGDLYYLKLDGQLNILSELVVDDSISQQGEDHLLADTSIALDSSGKPRIVYQDADLLALKIASWDGNQWRVIKLAGAEVNYLGAFGFFADQVIHNDISYISNYKYNLRDPNNPSSIDIRTWP